LHAIDHRDLEIILKQLTSQLAERLLQLRWMLSTAESCTGGMIATRCTDLAGSSTWFERGFVTYSNQSKTQFSIYPAETKALPS
jgi:nicotinamide-nucleotide amidase